MNVCAKRMMSVSGNKNTEMLPSLKIQYSWNSLVLLLILLASGKGSSNECTEAVNGQNLNESRISAENSYSNFSFRLTSIEENKKNVDFRIEIKLCGDESQDTACKCWWITTDDPVCKSQHTDWNCHADDTDMHFSLTVQRTHRNIMWVLFKQNSTPVVLKNTALQVTYPSKITGLQVNGQEVNHTHLAEESQEVTVSCSFTRGNPPESVSIVDEDGNTLGSAKHPGPLVLSLGVFHCHSDWPTVRCEAPGSKHNRSVSVFVKCPPQLSYVATKDLSLRQIIAGGLTVGMKSYTRDIRKCVMTRVEPKATSREVKCRVSGSAPKFNLTLRFDQEIWTGEGIWTLQVMSELGASSITFQLTNDTGQHECCYGFACFDLLSFTSGKLLCCLSHRESTFMLFLRLYVCLSVFLLSLSLSDTHTHTYTNTHKQTHTHVQTHTYKHTRTNTSAHKTLSCQLLGFLFR